MARGENAAPRSVAVFDRLLAAGPGNPRPSVGDGAVARVDVDQGLVGHDHLLDQGLEGGHRLGIEPVGHLLLEPLGVGVAWAVLKS